MWKKDKNKDDKKKKDIKTVVPTRDPNQPEDEFFGNVQLLLRIGANVTAIDEKNEVKSTIHSLHELAIGVKYKTETGKCLERTDKDSVTLTSLRTFESVDVFMPPVDEVFFEDPVLMREGTLVRNLSSGDDWFKVYAITQLATGVKYQTIQANVVERYAEDAAHLLTSKSGFTKGIPLRFPPSDDVYFASASLLSRGAFLRELNRADDEGALVYSLHSLAEGVMYVTEAGNVLLRLSSTDAQVLSKRSGFTQGTSFPLPPQDESLVQDSDAVAQGIYLRNFQRQGGRFVRDFLCLEVGSKYMTPQGNVLERSDAKFAQLLTAKSGFTKAVYVDLSAHVAHPAEARPPPVDPPLPAAPTPVVALTTQPVSASQPAPPTQPPPAPSADAAPAAQPPPPTSSSSGRRLSQLSLPTPHLDTSSLGDLPPVPLSSSHTAVTPPPSTAATTPATNTAAAAHAQSPPTSSSDTPSATAVTANPAPPTDTAAPTSTNAAPPPPPADVAPPPTDAGVPPPLARQPSGAKPMGFVLPSSELSAKLSSLSKVPRAAPQASPSETQGSESPHVPKTTPPSGEPRSETQGNLTPQVSKDSPPPEEPPGNTQGIVAPQLRRAAPPPSSDPPPSAQMTLPGDKAQGRVAAPQLRKPTPPAAEEPPPSAPASHAVAPGAEGKGSDVGDSAAPPPHTPGPPPGSPPLSARDLPPGAPPSSPPPTFSRAPPGSLPPASPPAATTAATTTTTTAAAPTPSPPSDAAVNAVGPPTSVPRPAHVLRTPRSRPPHPRPFEIVPPPRGSAPPPTPPPKCRPPCLRLSPSSSAVPALSPSSTTNPTATPTSARCPPPPGDPPGDRKPGVRPIPARRPLLRLSVNGETPPLAKPVVPEPVPEPEPPLVFELLGSVSAQQLNHTTKTRPKSQKRRPPSKKVQQPITGDDALFQPQLETNAKRTVSLHGTEALSVESAPLPSENPLVEESKSDASASPQKKKWAPPAGGRGMGMPPGMVDFGAIKLKKTTVRPGQG